VSRYLVLYRVHNIKSDDKRNRAGIAIRRARGLGDIAKKSAAPKRSSAVAQNSVTIQRSRFDWWIRRIVSEVWMLI
jgi:hypothetical protein